MSISVKIGAMMSGKTTALLEEMEWEKEAGRRVALLKHFGDVRYSRDSVQTHDEKKKAQATLVCGGDLDSVALYRDKWDAVFVDEGHFFTNLADFALRHAKQGMRVVVAGLHMQGVPGDATFEEMMKLTAVAYEICVYRAECQRCAKPALYTRRLGKASPVVAKAMTEGTFHAALLGAEEAYAVLCRHCVAIFDLDQQRPLKLMAAVVEKAMVLEKSGHGRDVVGGVDEVAVKEDSGQDAKTPDAAKPPAAAKINV